ncbi:50S ribosomal protein L18 [Candidatus Peregrinibacteria bacterium CG_4_10_14_0_2_um_filter_43_11]|nr:MAG: 50S ribosomal protein L18 [Candidatus Peregrinibacteria bacterium CG_4_10_14_0_2_um_filter_43_11]
MSTKKVQQRERRHRRIRTRVKGSAVCPRLSVFRSLTHIYAQMIDDVAGRVLVSSSSLKLKKAKSLELAKQTGSELAKKAIAQNITKCVFDRGGYLYHGRVKALAEGAREGGLVF